MSARCLTHPAQLPSVRGLSLPHSLSGFSERNTGLGTKTYLARDEMKPCRECRHNISEQAVFCPGCGAPYPGKDKWDGWGFEYKSQATLLGLPLLHVSFKYRPNRRPVPAKGVIAIGQFACGVVTISQFGLGVFSVGQFTIAGFALAQIALAYSLIAQMGIFLHQGRGQLVWNLADIIRRLT